MSNLPRTEINLSLCNDSSPETTKSPRGRLFAFDPWIIESNLSSMEKKKKSIHSEHLPSSNAMPATFYGSLVCIHCYDIIKSLASIKENQFSLK